ncbi:Thioredoxin and Transglutaminase domain containing protein [Aphelenchoides besseyi]|nr:Thioredoxin and Transglutaminase domain containing protein [Aphelenchoides besseyi]
MPIAQVNQDGQLDAILQAADYRLVVVDFYADWCGPFNVDHCQFTCQQYRVQAMPTFVLFVRGEEVERVQGANADQLRRVIDLHYKEPPKPYQATPAERQWLHENLVSQVDRVKQYEDEVNKMLALSVIPVDEINSKAKVQGKISPYEQAKHLLDWFHGFFNWIDNPKCQNCDDPNTKHVDHTECTNEERERGGGRVEVFNCGKCDSKTRFVRYNNPATLIETRQGRCGEWANCFTLCCRAIGLEARYIMSTEDHVWTEIYDPERGEWIHCDPCENIIDRPLLYEKGWKKEFKYVFGIANDHVQDVTWRYVFDQKACLKRRKMCRERVLLNCLMKLNIRLEKSLSEARKKELFNRRLRELIRFLSPKLNLRGAEDERGRISGGLDWRLSRGETQSEMKHRPTAIELSQREIDTKSFVLEYDVVNDVYNRPNSGKPTTKGFTSLLHECSNVQRKVERDWKMAYVCRTEGSKSSDFSWKIKFGDLKAKTAKISIGEFSLFHGGKATATVCGGDLCNMIEKNGDVEINELGSAEYIEISINLRGGDGDNAFQHSQLFRTSLTGPSSSNLRIEITFD